MKNVRIPVMILLILLAFIFDCKNPANEDPAPSYYIGNTNTHKFHRPSCSYLPDPENRITFSNRSEAVDAGYTPCGHCDP